MVYIKREVEEKVKKWVEEREIIAIRGPRQSGKTTLLKRISDNLEDRGVDRKNIHYFSFENDLDKEQFEKDPKEFIDFHSSEGRNYFLLDEVQYVKNVGKKLKLIFDFFENTKIIITGSSSFDLTNLGSYLVGRVVFFNLYPFSFLEFLRSKNEKYEQLYKKLRVKITKKELSLQETSFLEELNKFLHEYLTFGSYPRIVLKKNKDKKRKLLEDLFTTYVEKDIVGLYGMKYREGAVKLLRAASETLGSMVDYKKLSDVSGLSYYNVREILPLLENSFLISVVKPFHKNLLKELRKNPKIYFIDYGLRNYLIKKFENLDFSHLYENFIHNQLMRKYQVNYWRTKSKAEVDFIVRGGGSLIPIEVKTKPKVTRGFRSFINSYNPKKGIIANLNEIDKGNVNNSKLYKLPFVYF